MKYDGVVIYGTTETTGTVTIAHFNTLLSLTIQPPHDSNEDFTLHVTGNSVEVLDPLNPGTICQPLDILVDVKGAADPVTIGTTVAGFSEERLDAGALPSVSMDKVITATLLDNDSGRVIKSETLSFYFTGLDDGFAISGPHVTFLGGAGADRRWLLAPGDFANTILTAPKNFSGTVNFAGVPVTSENDGNSWTGVAIPLSITISPTPEATIVDHTAFNEDQFVRVNFDLQQQNGDTNETLTSVWIKAADVDAKVFTLFYDPDGAGVMPTQTFAAAGIVADIIDGYYKLTAEQSKHIYVQNTPDLHGSYTFEVKYEITDPTSDGTSVPIINPLTGTLELPAVTANSVTKQTTIAAYSLIVNAVTDPITDPYNTITWVDRGVPTTHVTTLDGTGTVVTVYGSTTLKVPVVVTQSQNPSDYLSGLDLDGSEKLERFIIDNVPDGITVYGVLVDGLTVVSATYIGDTLSTANTGRWILDVNPDVPFTSPQLMEVLSCKTFSLISMALLPSLKVW